MVTPHLLRRLSYARPTIMLVLGGALALALIALPLILVLIARGDAFRAADQQSLNAALAAGQEIGDIFQQHDRKLRDIVRKLQRAEASGGAPALQAGLFAGTAKAQNFDFINVLNSEGDVVADSGQGVRKGRNWNNRKYFTAQGDSDEDEMFIDNPFEEIPGLLGAIPLSRRWTHPDGSFAGVVVGMLRQPAIAAILRRFQVGAHGTIILLRDNGAILQRLPAAPEDMGHAPSDTRLQQPVASPMEMEDARDHVRRRVTIAPVPGLPLLIAVGLSHSDILTPWWNEFIVVVAAVLVLGLAGGGLFAATYRILRNRAVAEHDRAMNLAMMGHEVRGSVQTIVLCVQAILLPGNPKNAAAQTADAMLAECSHLDDMLKRVFDYTRIQIRGEAPEFHAVDLASLVDQCAFLTRRMIAGKNVDFEVRLDPSAPRWIQTDLGFLRTILRNLLDNAVAYTKAGSIRFEAAIDAAGLRFTVTDTGRSIPAELRDRLARPYERLDRGARPDGLGLGLFISRRFARLLDGQLEYRPNRPTGNAFLLRLPLSVGDSDEPPPQGVASAPQAVGGRPAGPAPLADEGTAGVVSPCAEPLSAAAMPADLRRCLLTVQSLLDSPSPSADRRTLDAAVDRLAKLAADAGYASLAAKCRRFQHGSETRDSLAEAVRAALTETAHRRQEPRNGESRSDMPE